jgi:hypothetical protein
MGATKPKQNKLSPLAQWEMWYILCNPKEKLYIVFFSVLQSHCYDFVHENVGNPALNTRPTILNHFFVHFYNFRDGLVKSLNSNIYSKNFRL